MICLKCGNEMKDGAKFCDRCGQKAESKAEDFDIFNDTKESESVRKNETRKPDKKKIGIIAGAAAAAILSVILIGGILGGTENTVIADVQRKADVTSVVDSTAQDKDSAAQADSAAKLQTVTGQTSQTAKTAQTSSTAQAANTARTSVTTQASDTTRSSSTARTTNTTQTAKKTQEEKAIKSTLTNLETAFENISTKDVAACFNTKYKTGICSSIDGLVSKIAEAAKTQIYVTLTPGNISVSGNKASLDLYVLAQARFTVKGKIHDIDTDTTITMTKTNGKWLIDDDSLVTFLTDEVASEAENAFADWTAEKLSDFGSWISDKLGF